MCCRGGKLRTRVDRAARCSGASTSSGAMPSSDREGVRKLSSHARQVRAYAACAKAARAKSARQAHGVLTTAAWTLAQHSTARHSWLATPCELSHGLWPSI